MKRGTLLSVLLWLAACGGGGDDPVAKMKGFSDRLCKCRSDADLGVEKAIAAGKTPDEAEAARWEDAKACGEPVDAEYRAWLEKMRETEKKEPPAKYFEHLETYNLCQYGTIKTSKDL
jgi:hypothetical protein